MIRIKHIEPKKDYWLCLTLSDGTVVDRNVRDLLRGPVFEHLRADYSQFSLVRARAGTATWPGGIDLDPDVLIWGGQAPFDGSARPAERLTLASRRELSPA